MVYAPIFLTGGWTSDLYDCLCKAVADTLNARITEVPLQSVRDTVLEESFAEQTAFVEWQAGADDDRINTVTIEVQYLCRNFTAPAAFAELRTSAWRILKILVDDDEGLIRAGGFGYVGHRVARAIHADVEFVISQGKSGQRYDGALVTLDYARGFQVRP